jgi:enoyl-CoA hydratase/carnithine racemase
VHKTFQNDEFFQIEERPGVRILRLRSADETNRLTLRCVLALTETVRQFVTEKRPLILAGNTHFFSAGADLKEITNLPRRGRPSWQALRTSLPPSMPPSKDIAWAVGWIWLSLAAIASPHPTLFSDTAGPRWD